MNSIVKIAVMVLSGVIAQPVFGQFKVQNAAGTETYMIVNDQGQVAIGTTSPASDATLDVNGITQTSGLRVGTSTAGQALVASDASGTAVWGTVGSAGVTDNSLTATDLNVDVVSSVEGVDNDGGDIDLVPSGNITITPNNANNTITIGSEPHTFVYDEYWSQNFEYTGGSEQIGNSYTVQQSGTYLFIVNVNLETTWTTNTGSLVNVYPTINDEQIPNAAGIAFGTNNEAVVRTPGSQTYLVSLSAGDNIKLMITVISSGSGAKVWGGGNTKITGVRLY